MSPELICEFKITEGSVEEAAGGPLPEEGAAEPEPGCRFCKFETLCVARLAAEGTP